MNLLSPKQKKNTWPFIEIFHTNNNKNITDLYVSSIAILFVDQINLYIASFCHMLNNLDSCPYLNTDRFMYYTNPVFVVSS